MTIPNEQETIDRAAVLLVGLSVCNCGDCQEQLRRGVAQEMRERAESTPTCGECRGYLTMPAGAEVRWYCDCPDAVFQAERRRAGLEETGTITIPQGYMFGAMNRLPDDRVAVFDAPSAAAPAAHQDELRAAWASLR